MATHLSLFITELGFFVSTFDASIGDARVFISPVTIHNANADDFIGTSIVAVITLASNSPIPSFVSKIRLAGDRHR